MVCKEHKEAINCLMAAPNRAWSGAKDGTIRLYTKSGFNCTTVKAKRGGPCGSPSLGLALGIAFAFGAFDIGLRTKI